MTILIYFRLWHRCGEGCSSGSSLPIDCDPAYGPTMAGPRDVTSASQVTQGNTTGVNPSQAHGEGESNIAAPPPINPPRYPVMPSLVDNVQDGVQIQRGGSLPNPIASSMLANAQSGPGGRASSLSSSQASRSSTAPVSQTPTTSAFSALIWKMNERGPTGLHTPAALASLAELLTNPPTVPTGQLTSALGTAGISIPENASIEKISPDLDHAMELKPCDNQVNELKAKVNFDLVLFTLIELAFNRSSLSYFNYMHSL